MAIILLAWQPLPPLLTSMQWVITLNLYSMDNKLSLKTFAAEALVPKETNVVLDWFLINAWALLLKLPQNKYIAWSRSILDILDANNISYCALEEQQIADSTTSLPGESISLPHISWTTCKISWHSSTMHRRWACHHIDANIIKDLMVWLKCMRNAAKVTCLYCNNPAFRRIRGYLN